jgi:hypothetical protein
LVDAYGGPTSFAGEVERRLKAYPELTESLRSYMDVSYVSRARSHGKNGKNIGEAPAMALEMLFEKPPGWMTGDAFENFLILMRQRRKAG